MFLSVHERNYPIAKPKKNFLVHFCFTVKNENILIPHIYHTI